SNPGTSCPVSCFQDRPVRPLRHPACRPFCSTGSPECGLRPPPLGRCARGSPRPISPSRASGGALHVRLVNPLNAHPAPPEGGLPSGDFPLVEPVRELRGFPL